MSISIFINRTIGHKYNFSLRPQFFSRWFFTSTTFVLLASNKGWLVLVWSIKDVEVENEVVFTSLLLFLGTWKWKCFNTRALTRMWSFVLMLLISFYEINIDIFLLISLLSLCAADIWEVWADDSKCFIIFQCKTFL